MLTLMFIIIYLINHINLLYVNINPKGIPTRTSIQDGMHYIPMHI